MSRLKGLLRRVNAHLRPGSADRRMEEEFAFHVEMAAKQLRAEGVPPDEARRRALATFGGLEQHRQEMREGRRANWLVDLRADLRYGARTLVRQKGLTTIAIVSLAIGIGANAALFSVVNSLLLTPRPFRDPDQLVELYHGHPGQPYQTASYPSYLDFRERNTVFSGLAAYGLGWQFRLGGPDEVREIWGEPVSGNYFDVLGIQLASGRGFLPEEDSVAGRNPVAVIGHSLWQRAFGGDSSVVGRSITLNSQPVTVVGVAPAWFNGMLAGWGSDVWVPAMATPLLFPDRADRISHRGSKWITMIGRLRPGVTVERARAEFAVLVAAQRIDHPDEWTDTEYSPTRVYDMQLLPESETRVNPQLRPIVHALVVVTFAAVNLVLAIACMNLAGLLLSRAIARRGEIAVRLALGAGRFRVVRQLLTESVLLAMIAGAGGLLLSIWGLNALIASIPPLPEGFRVAFDFQMDWGVVAYTMTFSMVTGVLFGLAPAIQSSGWALSTVLKDDAMAFAGRSRPSRSRRALIVGQVAASLLLLIVAGVMARSLGNVRPTSLGFASANFVVAPLEQDERVRDVGEVHRLFEQISARLSALPGVESVSLIDAVPGGFLTRTRRSTDIEGYTPRSGEDREIDASIVGPGYFTNMNIPVVLGRDFTTADRAGAPCVAIINDAFAERYFGNAAAALGRHLSKGESEGAPPQQCAIVGIVRDRAMQSLLEVPRPFFAMPILQSEQRSTTALVRTAALPVAHLADVRRALQALDATMPVADVKTLDGYFQASAFPFRVFGLVLAGGGLLALLLATIGIYGTVSQSVAQRRREVGIRMALGAERGDILRVVVGQGMRTVIWGIGLGAGVGTALTATLDRIPAVSSLLFGVRALDVPSLVAVTLLLVLVALLACCVPALRAARVDPSTTLRST